MIHRYATQGVCARAMEVETDGEKVLSVRIHGGCRGQANVLKRLVEGEKLDDIIPKLRGVQCRNGTSCADMLGRVLEQERELAAQGGVVAAVGHKEKKHAVQRR